MRLQLGLAPALPVGAAVADDGADQVVAVAEDVGRDVDRSPTQRLTG